MPSLKSRSQDPRRQLVVITGCDSGIGKCLTDILLTRGYAVLSSYLELPNEPRDSLHFTHRLDLRDEAQIVSFSEKALELTGERYRFFALVNNAGTASAAPIETLLMKALREVFEVNFFGMVALTQKLVPRLIEEKARVLIVGSAAGRVSLPYFLPYCASKFAVVAFADSLRRELAHLGVRIILAEPRAIASPIWGKTYSEIEDKVIPGAGDRYEKNIRRGAEYFVKGGRSGLSPEKAAAMIADILEKPAPSPRYTISKNRALVRLQALVPAVLADVVIARLFGR